MIGITSFGAYVPYNRLERKKIAEAFGNPVPPGEKAVANYDEDSITMGVAAAQQCCKGLNTQDIDALFFATTTAPYKEKQSATTIAAALDLRKDIRTSDYCNTLRGGSAALLGAVDSAQKGAKVLVTISDCRLGAADGPYENRLGDGAAAFTIGSENVIAEVLGCHSIAVDFHDLWRAEEDTFVRSWEERFSISQGYNKMLSEAATMALGKTGLVPSEISKLVCYGVLPRYQQSLAKSLGFTAEQLQDSLFSSLGDSGTAYGPMMLVAALEKACPGDTILFLTYGEGCDAIVLRITENITSLPPRRGIQYYLKHKKSTMNYEKYLRWKGLLQTEPAKRPRQERSALPDLYRNYNKVYALYGSCCQVCETPQFPPTRVCVHCQAVDHMEKYRFYGREARLVTYTVDYLSDSLDPPNVVAVVDFAGGGRMFCHLVDCELENIKVGMEIEMTFRRLFVADGIHTYFWKAIPRRDVKEEQ